MRAVPLAVVSALMLGCVTSTTEPTAPAESELVREAREAGALRYLEDEPAPAPALESQDGDESVWVWGEEDGPLCLRGDEFRFTTKNRGSDRLLVFLQGGGACWTDFCLAVTEASVGVPELDVLDNSQLNPLRDWNVAYLPYCDGSLFAGDNDVDEDGDGVPDRFHRGLHNLSAALRQAATEFPAPSEVLLTGSSAGGFGTLLATMLVRAQWPEARLSVFNDSGVGVARPGDQAFIDGLLEEFGAASMIPASCTDCTADGHMVELIDWTLQRDEDLRIAVFSSYYDSVIADVFLGIDPALFRDTLLAETGALQQAWPERYRRFFIDGVTHTALLGDATGIIGEDLGALEYPPDVFEQLAGLELGGIDVTVAETPSGPVAMGAWLQAYVERDSAWVDITEEPGPPPSDE